MSTTGLKERMTFLACQHSRALNIKTPNTFISLKHKGIFTKFQKIIIEALYLYKKQCLFFTGSNVSEVSVSQLEAAQTLILEVNHVQTMLKKAIKEREGAQQTLKEVQQTHQQQRVHYRQNTTLIDGLQRQLETLQKEKEALKSNTSQIRERLLHSCSPNFLFSFC